MSKWTIPSIVSFVILIMLSLAVVAAVFICKLSFGQQHPRACKISYITICICIGIMSILACVFVILRFQSSLKTELYKTTSITNPEHPSASNVPLASSQSSAPVTALNLLQDIRDKLQVHVTNSDFWDLNNADTKQMYVGNFADDIKNADNFALKTYYREPKDEQAIKHYQELRFKIMEAREYLITPVELRTSKPILIL